MTERPGAAMTAFDLDGCLIDSGALIRQAYRDAGVNPPADFLTLGHHDWIPPGDRAAVHSGKNAAYLRRLASDPLLLLPAWRVAERLHAAGRVTALLTRAPEGTASVLEQRAPSWPFTVTRDDMPQAGKTAWLASAGHGTYVDDQEYVPLPPGWRRVRYTGQDAEELYRQVAC